MKFSKMLTVIDSHTAGEANRIIVAGIPFLKGNSVMEQKQDLAANHDWIRKVQIQEPRGHADMFGSILVKPNHPDAQFGMIFTDGGGFLNMCGHGTIGMSTMLVEMGYVQAQEPVTSLVLEAPAGIIHSRVDVENGRVTSVSFTNVPSFLYKQDCELEYPGIGKIKFDIAFGGSFFVIIHEDQLKVKVCAEEASKIVPIALKLRDMVNENFDIKHPNLDITTVDLVEIYADPESEDADNKNIVVFGDGNIDRSPCGTGTSAKLATLHAKGKLEVGKPFVYESILNTKFIGTILEETTVGPFKAVVPQITGSAYICGLNTLVIDERDPLAYGFSLPR